MAFDESLAEEVRRALSGLPVIEKRMFGGLAFLVNGNMCVSVNNRPDHIMMVRINPSDKDSLKRVGAQTAIMRGREMAGWVFLTEKAIATEEDFGYWIQRALDFNKTLKAKGGK